MTTQTIAAEARAILARSGKRQAALAEHLGLSPSQLSRRLSGTIPFSAEEVAQMALFLDTPVEQFFPEQAA